MSVSHAYTHIVEFGTPVEVDGLKIHSGDLLHGDLHGVQSIPLGIAAQIPPVAAQISAQEAGVDCPLPVARISRLKNSAPPSPKKVLNPPQARANPCNPCNPFNLLTHLTPIVSRFAIRYPYLIIVICLIVCVVGVTSLVRMPVDLFPPINIPVVVVATFFSGMPPEQIETDITGRFERFFTLASGIDHMESRSLPGVSLIKVYFQPGFNSDSAVTSIANLAMANLRKLPPGTLPPVVLKFDASSLPVCLITLKGEGLKEAQLRDLGQYNVRNQVASVPGASVPQPFGGRYRQIMVYVDPLKLEAHQLSVMDVVRTVNEANLILPAGDVKIGPFDYNLYANSQINDDEGHQPAAAQDGRQRLGAGGRCGQSRGRLADPVQRRARGRPALGVSAGAQAGRRCEHHCGRGRHQGRPSADLLDVPKQLVTKVVFDQSVFVRTAIENLIHEGAIGLVLTGLMILVFLGSMRATVAVFLSIPLSALAAFIALSLGDSTINAMMLGGLALAFSRLIDNSVVVLENIFRHLEMGEAAGGRRRSGRQGSRPAGAGGDADDGGGVLPGGLPLRRQPVPVYGAGAGGGAVAVRLVRRGA